MCRPQHHRITASSGCEPGSEVRRNCLLPQLKAFEGMVDRVLVGQGSSDLGEPVVYSLVGFGKEVPAGRRELVGDGATVVFVVAPLHQSPADEAVDQGADRGGRTASRRAMIDEIADPS